MFYELSEKALMYRAQLLQFVRSFEEDEDRVLTGKDIEDVTLNLKNQLLLRKNLYQFIETYKNRFALKKLMATVKRFFKQNISYCCQ